MIALKLICSIFTFFDRSFYVYGSQLCIKVLLMTAKFHEFSFSEERLFSTLKILKFK